LMTARSLPVGARSETAAEGAMGVVAQEVRRRTAVAAARAFLITGGSGFQAS